MTVSYRDKFNAYKQEHENNYANIGSVFPVPVDSYSGNASVGPTGMPNGGSGGGGEIEEYSYKGYLYCDGRSLNIRDYPQLYQVIRNSYGGNTAKTITTYTEVGGLRRLYWVNNKLFMNFLEDPSVNSTSKLPYPYGVNFLIKDDTGASPAGPGLGSLPSNVFDYTTVFLTKAPTETLTAQQVPTGEFAYEIVFPQGVDPAQLPQSDVDITAGTHPTIQVNKSFAFNDTPHQIGTFNLPDLRDRVIVGVGDVDGAGTPTVENALINTVGQTGGNWYISKSDLLDGGTFFNIGSVRTTNYTNIVADVFTYLTGSVDFRVGPMDDYIFNRPVEHAHYILSSQPDEAIDNERGGVPVDEFATNYALTRANIVAFQPATGGGLALGHSHGLTREALPDATIATFGNTAGIGGVDPNQPADVFYDVSDTAVSSSAVYINVALEDHGPGAGEWEGFTKPGIAQGSQYLAFGYKAGGNLGLSTNPAFRSVTYTMDFTGYSKFYIFCIAGNDNNGGERPNDNGEGLYVEFSDGTTIQILPSYQEYKNNSGIPDGQNAFDLYDALYANWKEFEIDIPAALADTPNQNVLIKWTNTGGSAEQGASVPAGNENANDMYGIQGIGLRGGIASTPPSTPGVYPVTGSPNVVLSNLSYDSANGYVLATTAEAHGFDNDDYIQISGCLPDEYNGIFQINPAQFTTTGFSYIPETTPSVNNAPQVGVVKLAAGTFQDVTTTPAPKLYPIDSNTTIGGKVDVFTPPGEGTLFQSENITTATTFTLPAVPESSGQVTRIDVQLKAPGGGGGGSNISGDAGGYAFCILEIGGQSYTCYAYGGQPGISGAQGGAGGSGGTFLIPADLINNDQVSISGSSNGAPGASGGQLGPGTAYGGGALDGGLGSGGVGGNGSAGTFTTSNDTGYVLQNTNSWSAPGNANVINRIVTARVAGGGGGGGNGQANSGCEAGATQPPGSAANPSDGSATGGAGGGGALVTATWNNPGPSSLTWTVGQGGQAGKNERDGYANGPGYEQGAVSQGGTGSSSGGNGGLGAYGNGSTGGGGGGCTGVIQDGAIPIFGAGGGGAGGGAGGGYNGGGVTDGCYAGGNNNGAAENLKAQTTALDFSSNGANGTQGSCTAGGGGGGGGGCGAGGVANGGIGGTAGVGHNGNGGGSGGARGRSAYRSDSLAGATWSVANNGGAPGNAGGAGFVEIRVQDELQFDANVGGGGGQGATIILEIANINTAITAGLQGAGAGGGEGSTGGDAGNVVVEYRGILPGGDVEGAQSVPAGDYYECDVNGVPGGPSFTSNIWKSSSANGDPKSNDLKPVTPGNGQGNNGGFSMITSANGEPPTYGSRSTKYLPFAGAQTREYVIGPVDLTICNKIEFSVINGTGFNGGDAPEEDLLCYWRATGSSTTNLLGSIVSASGGSGTWTEYPLLIPENGDMKQSSVELIVRQSRILNQDDNADSSLDNYGICAVTFFYDPVTTSVFTPSNGTTLSGIDYVDRTVNVVESGLIADEGTFEMSSSTPITVTSTAVPEIDIPLVTKYHKVKYLIKAI